VASRPPLPGSLTQALGNFGRVHPTRPFLGPDGTGYGALELAFRASYLRLNDKGINGGRVPEPKERGDFLVVLISISEPKDRVIS